MATTAQILANRNNAMRSTGPRTTEGKAAASGNACSHGLSSSRFLVLPGEDAAEYESLVAALIGEHQPSSPTQEFLVIEMAQSQWKLQRVANIEFDVLTGQDGTLASRFAADCSQDQVLLKLNRYEQALRRTWYKALNQLRHMRSQDEALANRRERHRRQQASRDIDEMLAEALAVPVVPKPVIPIPEVQFQSPQPVYKTNPMPAHLQRELDAHKRRDPLFDPELDRSQMTKALQKWFAADEPSRPAGC